MALCHEYRRSTRRCATVREMKEGGVICGHAAIRPELAHKQTYRRTCKMTRMTRTRTLAALAIGCQVAKSFRYKSFRYLLTDHLKFDILHPAPAGRGPNAI